MEFLFFDTSALVKRYYEESGTDEVDELIEDDREVMISSLSVIEMASAFKRKTNTGELSAEELPELLAMFFREALDDFLIVPLEESFLEYSFDLIFEEDLRTLVSLQLSAALSINSEETTAVFVCADRNLVETAQNRSLETVHPGA